MLRRLFLLFILPLLAGSVQAQVLSGISTRWSDSFVEWDLLAVLPDSLAGEEPYDEEGPQEEVVGELKLRWLNLRDDWSEWDYTLGDERGTIKMKWKDDPTHWELRSFSGELVTMRAMWPNDPTEWRVTNNDVTLVLGSRWKNQFDEWLVRDSQYGNFYMYTLQVQDPRDWAIEDSLDERVSPELRLAMVFLTIFHSTPKQ